MKKTLLILSFALLFISCSDKKPFHEPFKNELLAYTQKFEIIKKDEKYLAVATYLNPVLKLEQGAKERFILSSYPKNIDINLKSLKVNGSDENLTINKLQKDDELLKLTNINLPWSNHYEIIAPEKQSDYLTITYETNHLEKVSLRFLKVSKSMYWTPRIKLEDK
ncbi:hypothetical protein [Campylobacter geochelonis]|uniref:Putative lipoprotein n=1 Tax=Campylobacter geochelonis TaxID=1780362 RepID=A0A128ELK9_9BACT|nr:hypothetical protein [Campylobacter geochelonis]CZE49289.1 putative lipoprotein [Campylobacter geochelonis]CZE49401.1 putative lipoprotein [Campylobacter geochelonis]